MPVWSHELHCLEQWQRTDDKSFARHSSFISMQQGPREVALARGARAALLPALAQVGDTVALVYQPLGHQHDQRDCSQPAPELLAADPLVGGGLLQAAGLLDLQV